MCACLLPTRIFWKCSTAPGLIRRSGRALWDQPERRVGGGQSILLVGLTTTQGLAAPIDII